MKERINALGADLIMLAVIGLAAFGGQTLANYLPLFGSTPVVRRLVIIEDRLDKVEHKLDRKLGF